MNNFTPPDVCMVESAMGKIPQPATPGSIINSIKADKYRAKVQKIRKLYRDTLAATNEDHSKAKRAVDELKKRLPGIMWSGTFNGRGDNNLVGYSGLLCADFDHVDASPELYQKLRVDPHVYAAFA